MKRLPLFLAAAAVSMSGFGLDQSPSLGPTTCARYATDAYPGFDSEDKIVNTAKKEPRWFGFWNGPKYDNAHDQYEWCKELVKDESWSAAVKALDALVREWPAAAEAAKAQEALAKINLDYLDDAEEAFAEYKYLLDYYSLSCDYAKTADILYQIAGKMRLEGKTIMFFRFRNAVDVRRAYEACVLRAPGAMWTPEAMLTIGELREEDQDYTEAVKVYENLRNLHGGTKEAKRAVARESEARMQLLKDHGYNRERTEDTINFLELALRLCDDADRALIEECYQEAKALIETEAWKAAKFYDSPTRTKRSAINAYERYLKDYPDGEHAEEAKARLEELKGSGETP